jgi:2-dehydro-3-deoxy-D-gluconate 5-dehydrogenase
LEGRSALVIGGGGGLGAAMAGGLSEAGVAVAIMGRSATLEDAAAAIGGGRQVVAVRCDVTDRDALDRAIDDVDDRLGRIDILVAAQGIAIPRPVLEHDDDAWDATLETNLTSVFRSCRRVGAQMAARGYGKIVTVASMLSFSGGMNVAAYAASKGGVAQLTKAFANELAPFGVNVNAIAPGYIKTNANAHIWRDNPTRSAEILARLPSGRWGQPADMVGPLLFLCSSAADYLHGVVLPVDGGWLSR